MKRSRLDKARDKTAMRIANFAIGHIATKWYRDWIFSLVSMGMSAVEEKQMARPRWVPPHMRRPDARDD